MVSELMTNALEASLPGLDRQGVSLVVAPLELRLSAEGRHLRIEIRDHIPDPPVLEEPDVDDERGRGLLLVDSYAKSGATTAFPRAERWSGASSAPPAEDACRTPHQAHGAPDRPQRHEGRLVIPEPAFALALRTVVASGVGV